MTIDFNTNFKDFLKTSQVYKNIMEYIYNSESYTNLEKPHRPTFEICVQAAVECLVINHEVANSNHYARADVEDLVGAENSAEVRKAFKKPVAASQHVKYLTYLYFTEENKELTHLREEIYEIAPSKAIVVNFNTNYQGFLENSPTYSKIFTAVCKDRSFTSENEEEQKKYRALTYTAVETIIINAGVCHTISFRNSNLVDLVGSQNSKHVQKYIKQNKKSLRMAGNFVMALVRLILSRPVTKDKSLAHFLEEELEAHDQSLQKSA